MIVRTRFQYLALAAAAALAAVAGAQTVQFKTPNVINTPGPLVSELNGLQFTNNGLVGVGRIPAFLDAQGSTFGSVSSMAMAPGSWAYDAASQRFTGRFLTLPDRGRNDPNTGSFVNYQGRVQKVDFSFTPLYAGNGASQNQIQFDYQGLTLLAEATGAPTVGNDPGAGAGTAFGKPVPRINGNIALDAEGLVALPNGDYFVSDEYASSIYRFDSTGVMTGVISPPDALLPRDAANNPSFSSLSNPSTGRRPNQGMEALSLSPDGRYLMAMNQSAAMQDSGGSNQTARRHTRVLVYDLAQGPTPDSPVGHYVMELPTHTANGGGGAVNRTSAQSEMIALSDTKFLVLSRDGNGRGSQNGNPKVHTSVLLADLEGATNLVGTSYEGVDPVSPNGGLVGGIDLVENVEALNLLNMFDLTRFGLNLDINAGMPNGDVNTLSEKWEGLALAPDLSTLDPFDYFLFVANDNDFLATNGVMHTTDGAIINYSDPFDNDTMFLAYSVRLVPEPASLAGLLVGAALAGLRRRT